MDLIIFKKGRCRPALLFGFESETLHYQNGIFSVKSTASSCLRKTC